MHRTPLCDGAERALEAESSLGLSVLRTVLVRSIREETWAAPARLLFAARPSALLGERANEHSTHPKTTLTQAGDGTTLVMNIHGAWLRKLLLLQLSFQSLQMHQLRSRWRNWILCCVRACVCVYLCTYKGTRDIETSAGTDGIFCLLFLFPLRKINSSRVLQRL